jgi:hypothetical protein
MGKKNAHIFINNGKFQKIIINTNPFNFFDLSRRFNISNFPFFKILFYRFMGEVWQVKNKENKK